MRISVAPATSWGRWSVGFAIAFIVLFGLFLLLVASGQGGPEFNPVLAAAIIPAGISGVAAFVTSLIGLVLRKERSATVLLTTVIGWFVLVFVVGEFLFPH